MKKLLRSILLVIFLTASSHALTEGNQTMTGGFDFHGEIESGSTNKNLIVTGNVVFPIVNKYQKENHRTNEPGKVIERLEWALNLEKFPVIVDKAYCTASNNKVLKSTMDISNCLNKKVSITIRNPVIGFNEFGLAISIKADKASIVPFHIIQNSGGSGNGL